MSMSGQIGNPKGRPPDPPPAQSLTEGLLALASRPLTPADLARAALHLVDWLGCVLTGAAGALAMGGFGSLLEMDDVHRAALLHPGLVVMPV